LSTHYSVKELQETINQLSALRDELIKIAARADKNREEKALADLRRKLDGTGEFTEGQVRDVLAGMLQFRADTGVSARGYGSVGYFVNAVIRKLREPEFFENSSYYRDPDGQIWKYSAGGFYRCGDMKRYARADLSSPLERVT
jgi:hypothetical protein